MQASSPSRKELTKTASSGSGTASDALNSNAMAFLYASKAQGVEPHGMEEEGGFLWYEPYYQKASQTNVNTLRQILSSITGRNTFLKPEEPAPLLLTLLSKMSSRTARERALVAKILEIYSDRIKIKDLGHTSTVTTKKETKNPKGIAPDGLYSIQQAAAALNDHFKRDENRRRIQERELGHIVERFHNTLGVQKVQQKILEERNGEMLAMKAAMTASKRMQESTILARYDYLGSDIAGTREFFALWQQQDGEPAESYLRVEELYRKKQLEKKRRGGAQDLAAKERALEEQALAYAQGKIDAGIDLVFDDRLFQHKLDDKATVVRKPAFSWRDVPSFDSVNVPFNKLRSSFSIIYRDKLASTQRASISQTPSTRDLLVLAAQDDKDGGDSAMSEQLSVTLSGCGSLGSDTGHTAA